jgi:hypothetical protein
MLVYNEQIVWTLIGVIRLSFIETSDNEHRLVDYLFSQQDYNSLVRPVKYSNETVVVSFGLLLVQLIHVN